MTYPWRRPHENSDDVTKASLAAGIGFSLPEHYNASRLLWDNLPVRADKPAIYCDTGIWTYGQLADEAARVGNALLDLGCAPGERVLLYLDDVPAYPATIMGTMRAGLVPMLINTLSTPDLLRFYLEDSGATSAVVAPEFAGQFDSECLAGTACRHLLLAGEAAGGQHGWDVVREASSDLPEAPTRRHDPALWMYSSGSTGKPKGVVHCHAAAAYTAATYARYTLGINEGDICFSVPKIFFAYGFGNSVSFPMSVGAAAVLMNGRPQPDGIVRHINEFRPTLFFGLPTLYTALMRSEAIERAELSSVRLCLSAAEILSAEIADAWRQRFGHDIVEGLGSTEMLHIYLANAAERQKYGSAGQCLPGYAVKLTDQQGNEVPPGEEGIMSVCGLSALSEYWQRPDKTEETVRGEWVYTGDRFVCDEDGFYFFRGRADDLVKVSGQWVYPLEIELALAEHPEVNECCVMAIPMADRRMTLQAWVVPNHGLAGGDALTGELQAFLKKRLLPHKYPRRVAYLDELPKTGTGKLDRQALKNSLGQEA